MKDLVKAVGAAVVGWEMWEMAAKATAGAGEVGLAKADAAEEAMAAGTDTEADSAVAD